MSVQKKCLCGFAFFTLLVGIIGFLIGYYARPRAGDQARCSGAKNENCAPSWDLEFERKALALVSTEHIRLYLKYFTNHSHRAGADASDAQAQYIEKEWKADALGFDSVETKRYDILLSYPERPSVVSLIHSNGTVAQSWLSTERSLEPTVLFPYSAYSASGTAEGKLVYVNYGRESDFKYLENINITCLGRVVILRLGKIHGSQKAENAQKWGAIGVILYSDPGDYTWNVQAEYKWFANDTVQGGNVWAWNGDPLTPGYPAMAGIYRQPDDKVPLIKIPVQPISYTHAEPLLRALNRTVTPGEWQGGLDFVYRIQMAPSDDRNVSINVSLVLETRPVYNVVATIKGLVEPDRYVLLGNPRDARAFGAVVPSTSGSAVMMEVARSLLAVRKKGWRPRRTIKLCSWGATHFGVTGSGEWVKEYKKVLGARAVAYINVENGVEGNFSVRVKGSPLLKEAVFEAAKKVKVNSLESLYEEWKRKVPDETKRNPSVESVTGEGDCLFFANILGVPCIDLGYRPDNTSGAHPIRHAVYGTFDWLEKLVDPTLAYHKALAELWLQLTFIIAGSVLIPFEVNRYAKLLDTYSRELWDNCRETLRNENLTLDVLLNSTSDFIQAGNGFEDFLSKLDKNDVLQVRMANDRLLQVDRAFVDKEGLPGRTSMRHVVFAPSLFNTENKTKFPGITDSIFIARKRRKSEDWNRVKNQISVVVNAVQSAISVLMPADS